MSTYRKLSSLPILLLFLLLYWSPTTSAEQIWTTDKSSGCRFSIPVHSKDIKMSEISWRGPCKNNLAEGEGPIVIKFYLLPNDKTLVTVDGTLTMVNGQLHGKGSLRWSYGLTFEGEYVNGERSNGNAEQ